jgi:NADH-quinone oxidoreductase subunit G
VRMKHNTHLSQMAKEPFIRVHPLEASKRNLKSGSAVKVHHNGYFITGKLKIDERVAGVTVVIPVGFDDIATYELGPELRNGLPVSVTSNDEEQNNGH